MIIYISLPMHGHNEADTRDRAERAKNYIQEVLNAGFRKQWAEQYGGENAAINVVSPLDVARRLDEAVKAEAQQAAMFNPAYATPRRLSDVDYLLEDLRAVSQSNLVVVLDGWESSRGCLAEVAFAKARGIAVVELSESLGFCQFQTGSMERLDDAIYMPCTHHAADAFITSFYEWRSRERKRNPMASRLNQQGPIDDLPWN